MAGENHVCATPSEQDVHFNRPELHEVESPITYEYCEFCKKARDIDGMKPIYTNGILRGFVCINEESEYLTLIAQKNGTNS